MSEQPNPVTSILEIIWSIASEIIKLVICFVSALASCFLIYIFFKFDKVKKKCNIFLLHYAITSLIDVLLVPLIKLVSEIAFSGFARWEVFCVLFAINGSTNILVFWFGAAIGVYWFIENFQNSWIKNKRRFEIFTTIGIYIVCIIKLIVVTGECFVEESLFTTTIIRIVYVIKVLLITGINIFVKRRGLSESQIKTRYELTISSYIIYSFFPLFVFSFCFSVNWSRKIIEFLLYIYSFAEYLAYSGTIVITYILLEKSKYFKVAYKSIFKRSVKHYDEEELNEESEEDEETIQSNTGSNNNANLGFI